MSFFLDALCSFWVGQAYDAPVLVRPISASSINSPAHFHWKTLQLGRTSPGQTREPAHLPESHVLVFFRGALIHWACMGALGVFWVGQEDVWNVLTPLSLGFGCKFKSFPQVGRPRAGAHHFKSHFPDLFRAPPNYLQSVN